MRISIFDKLTGYQYSVILTPPEWFTRLRRKWRIWRGSRRDLQAEIYGLRCNVSELHRKLNNMRQHTAGTLNKNARLKEQHRRDRKAIDDLKTVMSHAFSTIDLAEAQYIILKTDERLSEDAAGIIQQQVRLHFPRQRGIILDSGMTLETLTDAEMENLGWVRGNPQEELAQ